jgi:Mn2+/Fe2+ NRAMP family transporter
MSWATVRLQYHQIANVLKWMVLVLFAYPVTASVVRANWGQVLHDTLVPSMPHSRSEWATLVAILWHHNQSQSVLLAGERRS